MDKQNSDNSTLSKWLEKLQEESWHLELLISGFAIIGLFHAGDYVEIKLIHYISNSSTSLDGLVQLLWAVLLGAIVIFKINLIVHLILRGLWIGAIGLRYVSGDIDYDELKISESFREHYRRTVGSFDVYIELLEKLASIIFSYTFLLSFVFFSLFLGTAVLAIFSTFMARIFGLSSLNYNYDDADIANPIRWSVRAIMIVYMVLALLVSFDFITLGLLKRIRQPLVSRLFLAISKFFGFITLSFVWRPLLLNFLDDKFAIKFLYLTLPYFFGLIFLTNLSNSEYAFFPQHRFTNGRHFFLKSNYQDESFEDKPNPISHIRLDSKLQSGRFLDVFLKYDVELEEMLDRYEKQLEKTNKVGWRTRSIVRFGSTGSGKDGERNKDNSEDILSAIEKYSSLSIDGEPLNKGNLICNFYIHPNADEKGLLCYARIDSLEIGKHILTYEKVRVDPSSDDSILLDTLRYDIPFIYEGP